MKRVSRKQPLNAAALTRRAFALCLSIMLVCAGFAPSLAEDSSKLKVVTTNFPPYDFVRQIAGDLVDITMLLQPGAESHSYEPTPRDIIAIDSSDLFIYTGGEDDAWVDRILSTLDNGPTNKLAMLDMVEAVPEEIVEGMEHEHEHEHEEEEEVFDPSTVKDRSIRDFNGDWKTGMPYLLDGTLDEWITANAEAKEISFDEMLLTYKDRWRSDYDSFSIYNGVAALGGVSALYAYDGFATTETSAWYILKLADGTPGAPTYLMFNDHGTGNAEEAHDHGEEAVAHTHFLYGESVEEALSADNWSTMYYDADASGEQILLTMLGVTKDERISAGYFTESDVVDRATMVDWYGDWQSAYPLVADGSLDFVWPEKAEAGDGRTAEEYKEYYASSYKTEWDRLVIKGDTITYYKNDGTSITATYEYKGPTPLIYYDDGTAYMRFNYEAVGDPQGAPRYVQFADHNCRPTSNLEHFHLYMGEDGFDKLYENMTNWPTYYPSDMSALEIGEEMIGHDSSAHSHSHDHEEEEVEFDEHVWTSPKNAKLIIAQITEELASLDPANAQTYRTNAAAYLSKLDALDLAFQDVVSKAARNTIVFGDRFPFRYFADAYDLEYYAAFSGCSTETEASAATIKFLIDKVNDEQIPVVFHIELSNEKIADTICEATGAKKLLMHTVHNVTRDDFDKGIGYLELMTEDIERLKEALW